MGDDGGHSGFGQGRGGNDGMSGAPMWQIKRKMAEYDRQREKLVTELIAESEDRKKPAEAPNVMVDALALGGGLQTESKVKPLVRHVVVKDFNKVAQMKKIEFPKSDLFSEKAPIGLYAVFDGQACSSSWSPSTPGTAAVDFCARNFHLKVLDNLQMLRQGSANEAYVKAALIKSFHDLDEEYLAQKPTVEDGCGAAVALLLGQHVFVATIGRCGAALAEVASGQGGPPRPMQLGGQAASLSASLGEPSRKRGPGASSTPEVHCVKLHGPDSHPFLLLASSTVVSALNAAQLVEAAADYCMQPRIVCLEILQSLVTRQNEKSLVPQQMVLAQVCFLPAKDKAPDKKQEAAKKPKLGSKDGMMNSMRLRHIMLRTQESTSSKQPASAASAKVKATRTRQEAEQVLRNVLKDLRQNLKAAEKAPKTVNDLVVFQGKRFGELCREHSDCPSAKKGGATCGDLGWMSLEDMSNLGGNFREKCDPLKPGQWSDICGSDQGIHLVQRVA